MWILDFKNDAWSTNNTQYELASKKCVEKKQAAAYDGVGTAFKNSILFEDIFIHIHKFLIYFLNRLLTSVSMCTILRRVATI